MKTWTFPEFSGRLRFPDFMTIDTWRQQGCQPSRKYSWYSFLLEAESPQRPECGQKDYVNEKFQWNYLGPNPSTFSFVTQCLNEPQFLYIWTEREKETDRQKSYVYWTVHHRDSWINQHDVTCFFISLFNAQHVSDVNTSILRSLRLICCVISWLCCSGSMRVGVKVWFAWVEVLSLRRLKHCFSLQPETTPPQPYHKVTPTHIVQEQYNPWNNSTNKSQLLRMDVLTSETCWALNSEIKKQVTSSWSIFIQLSRWYTVQ
jgi:hypothetical protein